MKIAIWFVLIFALLSCKTEVATPGPIKEVAKIEPEPILFIPLRTIQVKGMKPNQTIDTTYQNFEGEFLKINLHVSYDGFVAQKDLIRTVVEKPFQHKFMNIVNEQNQVKFFDDYSAFTQYIESIGYLIKETGRLKYGYAFELERPR